MAPRKAKNTTRQGANFELQIMHHLSELGYDVLRSSASRGKIDVVAVGDIHTLWIQAKISNPRLSPADRIAVVGMAARADRESYTNLPIVAYRVKGQVVFRALTGTGPSDFLDFRPFLHPTALCNCGHQHAAHARGTGCWQRTEDDRSCGCHQFIFPSKAKKETPK